MATCRSIYIRTINKKTIQRAKNNIKKKGGNLMKKFDGPSSTIIRVIDHLDKQKKILQKELDIALIKEGKAYECKRCNKIVRKGEAGDRAVEDQVCSNCWSTIWTEKKRDQLEHLVSGVVTFVELDSWYKTSVRRIDVYRDGKIHRLQVNSPEDGVSTLDLMGVEKATEKPVVDTMMRPWQKERKERPLIETEGQA
jgi:hypothetical protein